MKMLAAQSALLVIDVQEKLMAKIPAASTLSQHRLFDRCCATARRAGQRHGAVSRGLGPTVPGLIEKLPQRPDKIESSASCAVPSIMQDFHSHGPRADSFDGHRNTRLRPAHGPRYSRGRLSRLPAGGRAGQPLCRRSRHRPARLEKAGAILTTCETAVFEWVGGAGHPKFKQVSALVQERMKAMGNEQTPVHRRWDINGRAAKAFLDCPIIWYNEELAGKKRFPKRKQEKDMPRTSEPKRKPLPQRQPRSAIVNGPLDEVLTLAETAAYFASRSGCGGPGSVTGSAGPVRRQRMAFPQDGHSAMARGRSTNLGDTQGRYFGSGRQVPR